MALQGFSLGRNALIYVKLRNRLGGYEATGERIWERMAARKLRLGKYELFEVEPDRLEGGYQRHLNCAIRDIDAALVWMHGQHVSLELKAQGDELKAIKDQLLAIMAKPAHAFDDP